MFELVGRKGLVPIQYDLREKNIPSLDYRKGIIL